MDNITRQILTKPFPFGSHKWRVLNTTKDKDKATWYVYIDARDVAQRLDSTGLDWSDEYEVIVMDDKLCVVQCKLTIGNSTRTDVGSDSKQSNDGEGNYIKGAFSDALKRAAVKFGIGRYLYGMTSFYVPIDQYKKFTPEALTKIKAHLTKELAKVGAEGSADDLKNEDEDAPEPTLQELASKTTPTSPVTPVTPTNGNGNGNKTADEAPTVEMMSKVQQERLNGLGRDYYGGEWNRNRHRLVMSITKGRSGWAEDLTYAGADKLINGLQAKINERDAALAEALANPA